MDTSYRMQRIQQWIEMILGESLHEQLHETINLFHGLVGLESSQLLCHLVIHIYTALGMESFALSITVDKEVCERNIETFRAACIDFGVSEVDCFPIVNVVESASSSVVEKVIHSFEALIACITEKSKIKAQDHSRVLELAKQHNLTNLSKKRTASTNVTRQHPVTSISLTNNPWMIHTDMYIHDGSVFRQKTTITSGINY